MEEIEKCDILLPISLLSIKHVIEQPLLSYLNKKNEIYEEENIRRTGRRPLYPHGRPADDFKRKK